MKHVVKLVLISAVLLLVLAIPQPVYLHGNPCRWFSFVRTGTTTIQITVNTGQTFISIQTTTSTVPLRIPCFNIGLNTGFRGFSSPMGVQPYTGNMIAPGSPGY